MNVWAWVGVGFVVAAVFVIGLAFGLWLASGGTRA